MFGIKASLQGFDATNCQDGQLCFSSEWQTFKLIYSGTVTFNVSQENTTVTVFNHNLGYNPFFFSMCSSIGQPGGNYVYIDSCDTTSYYVKVGSGGKFPISVSYYIFALNLEQNYTLSSTGNTNATQNAIINNYGIKATIPNYDIYTNLDRTKFAIDSNEKIIKVIGQAYLVGNGTITINYNLGYTPTFYLLISNSLATGYAYSGISKADTFTSNNYQTQLIMTNAATTDKVALIVTNEPYTLL
jgi:hypothetical protein